VWHLLTKQQDYAWARPSLTEQKRRKLELRAGQTAYRGQRGRAHAYNLKILRTRERAIGEQAERAYQTLVAHWRPQPRKRGTGAANAARR
jgi:transposase